MDNTQGASISGSASARTLFGRAWLGLAAMLALHVADEALHDFLSVYNPAVLAIRERVPWLPLPTFTFGIWIAGLAALIVLLFLLSPLAFRGVRWFSVLAGIFAAMMIGNGLLHLGSSVARMWFMPGVYSSPFLIVAAGAVVFGALRVLRSRSPA